MFSVFGLPKFYKDPIPHASFASASRTLPKEELERPNDALLAAAAAVAPFSLNQVVCRIGNKMFVFEVAE